jgi:hypothetical protein
VTVCHRTHSKKRPYHKITVSQNAVPAHLRHGDLPSATGAPCPTQVVGAAGGKHGGRGKGK